MGVSSKRAIRGQRIALPISQSPPPRVNHSLTATDVPGADDLLSLLRNKCYTYLLRFRAIQRMVENMALFMTGGD